MIARRALAGALLLAPGPVRAQSAIDLMPDFWRAYDAAREGSFEDRGRALIAGYFTPHLQAYRDVGIGRVDLARWLAVFDPMASAVRRLSDGFPAAWSAHAARFGRALPDFDAAAPVTVFVSFLNFDARVRVVGDRVALFVGLDGVVRFGAGLGVLLAHECFHLYHHQVNPTLILPGGDPLWLGVWKEGLAVQASAVLDPDADATAVLLGERALAQADAALIRRMAAGMLPLLDETAGAPRARFLNVGAGGDFPSRSAYLIGWRIAQNLPIGRDLAALARVPASEAREIVRRHVARLAAG